MAQAKIIRALDPRETGDVIKFFETFDGILEKNSGVHDCKCLTNDSYDPPCPLPKNMYTKVKLTDDAIHITNIDKSYISMRVSFDLKLDVDPTFKFNIKGTHSMWSLKNYVIFVGFKSAIHCIDAYRIYSRGKKTTCEQTEALYENAVTYFLKPEQEICNRPNTYSPWENVAKGSRNVCGVYIPLDKFMEQGRDIDGYVSESFKTNQTLTIAFDLNIPFDDFLPLSAMSMFPNCLFGNLVLELKQTIQNNLVFCQLPFDAAYRLNEGDQSIRHEIPTAAIDPCFTQINDTMTFKAFSYDGDTADAKILKEKSTPFTLTCLNGQILTCRSNINGFNIKQAVLDTLLNAYAEKEMIIPAQIVDYQAFSQTVQPGGLKCNTTYTLTNITNVILTFPRTGNQITVSKNPNFGNIQLQIEGKPYPDKPFSTLETAHTEFNLVNANLDSIWAPNKTYAYSLTGPDYVDFGGDMARARITEDDGNYCFNCSTERLCGAGVFCDGLSKMSAHINLSATNADTTKTNPYLFPDGANKNDVAPLMMLVQDTFWRCTTKKGVEWVSNNPVFYEEQTGSD